MPWNKGRKMTQTTRERISLALRGRTAWNKGKSWPNSIKKKISKSKKGKTTWNKGRKWPVKVRKKISKTKLFPENKFKELYDTLEAKFNSNYLEIDKYIKGVWVGVPVLQCDRNEETRPTHIRHCFHHKKHGAYSSKELSNSIRELTKIVKNLN